MGKYKILIVLLLSILGLSCEQSMETNNSSAISYQTSDPSRLFFKNMKSINYDLKEAGNSKIEFYQLKKWESNTPRPLLIPVIANNWLEDKAYLLLKKNVYWRKNLPDASIIFKSEHEEKSFKLERKNPEEQTQMALEIYDALTKQEGSYHIHLQDSTQINLFKDNMDLYYFTTTVKDYLRLIDRI